MASPQRKGKGWLRCNSSCYCLLKEESSSLEQADGVKGRETGTEGKGGKTRETDRQGQRYWLQFPETPSVPC